MSLTASVLAWAFVLLLLALVAALAIREGLASVSGSLF